MGTPLASGRLDECDLAQSAQRLGQHNIAAPWLTSSAANTTAWRPLSRPLAAVLIGTARYISSRTRAKCQAIGGTQRGRAILRLATQLDSRQILDSESLACPVPLASAQITTWSWFHCP